MTWAEVAQNALNAGALGMTYFFLKKKVEVEAKPQAKTSQVEELAEQVAELQNQMTALNVKVSKVLPQDHRGPK